MRRLFASPPSRRRSFTLPYQDSPSAVPANWTIGGQRYAYVSNAAGSVSAYRIDPATGAPVPVTAGGATGCYPPPPSGPPFPVNLMNCFPAAIAPAAIAVSPNGRFVYVADCEGPPNNISAYAIDPGTGALVQMAGSPFLGGPHPFSVQVDASGRYLVVAQIGPSDGAGPAPRQGSVGVYAIDPVSGVPTEVEGSSLFPAGELDARDCARSAGSLHHCFQLRSRRRVERSRQRGGL